MKECVDSQTNTPTNQRRERCANTVQQNYYFSGHIGALQANASPRILELARPKRLADGYQESRSVIWKVLAGAKNAVASGRYANHDIHANIYLLLYFK